MMRSLCQCVTSLICYCLDNKTRLQQPCKLVERNTEIATQGVVVVKILETNYKKADLPAVIKTCTHLSYNEQMSY
jgi:hypothetical protein